MSKDCTLIHLYTFVHVHISCNSAYDRQHTCACSMWSSLCWSTCHLFVMHTCLSAYWPNVSALDEAPSRIVVVSKHSVCLHALPVNGMDVPTVELIIAHWSMTFVTFSVHSLMDVCGTWHLHGAHVFTRGSFDDHDILRIISRSHESSFCFSHTLWCELLYCDVTVCMEWRINASECYVPCLCAYSEMHRVLLTMPHWPTCMM